MKYGGSVNGFSDIIKKHQELGRRRISDLESCQDQKCKVCKTVQRVFDLSDPNFDVRPVAGAVNDIFVVTGDAQQVGNIREDISGECRGGN